MTVAFLATGDEIVHGDTLNRNSQTIPQALCSEGIPLGFHMACSDKEEDMLTALSFLGLRHDIIITSGGLGPTSDDRTRFAVANYLQCELVERPEAIEHIEQILQHANLNLTTENRQQALFPDSALLLANENGTAMGCIIPAKDNYPMIICLPGPPHECMPILLEQVLPYLSQETRSDKIIHRWMIFGQPESQIARTLDEALSSFQCTTGYRMDTPYVEFKVKMRRNDESDILKIIMPIIKPHLLSNDIEKASEKLKNHLASYQGEPICIIDEITGGLLQNLIQTPDTVDTISFIASKAHNTTFHLKGFAEFWHPVDSTSKTTECTIDFQSKLSHGSESHTLPYRHRPSARLYITEWLSFRLLHLINQLH